MAATAEKSRPEESVKEWARRIAAQAPPLADDQFHQLRTVMLGDRRRRPAAVEKKAA